MTTAHRLHAAVLASAVLAAAWLACGSAQAQGRDEPVQQVVIVGKRFVPESQQPTAQAAPAAQAQPAQPAVQQVVIVGRRMRPEVLAQTQH